MFVIVIVRMVVRMAASSVPYRNWLGRRKNKTPCLDSFGTNQIIGEVSDLPRRTTQQDHFQTAVLVKMNVGCCDDLLEMVMLHFSQPARDSRSVVVVD